ncbi:MAG: DNA polymerase IV [Planctomycetes bacterium]|nr:DNA polymerase IV [Planctomycetota bacterium]MCP4772216.1 DNA polymerase IV [Planctomycetota bacterium]MCP4861272.1 DNA polymerase IV [Planctomycetota bacterium]
MNFADRTRSILHVDLDAFFVSVERVLDPRLNGRPVVVGGPPEGRGVVAAASYEARQYGVHSAMPMGQALRLCPDLVRVGGSHGMYSRASKAVFDLIGGYTPLVEKVSVDEAYLDLSGTHHLFGNALDAADKMRREVKERLRLDLTVGASSNRLVSKVASGFAKPCGLFDVRPGQEPRFFSPLPIKVMPGIGPVTAKRLHDFHIDELGVLASTERWFLEEVFGSYGPSMQRRAHGVDETPVCPPWERPERKSLGHERTFAEDTDDLKVLRGRLQRLLEQSCAQLRSEGLLARTLSVKLRYADFVTETRDLTLPQPSDHDLEWWEVAEQQLERMLKKRRTLVRLLGVRFSGMERGFWQGGLFEQERVVQRGRIAVLDKIRSKYGEKAVQSGDRLWLRNSR